MLPIEDDALGKWTGRIVNQRKNRVYPEHNIVKIDMNPVERLEDQRRFAVTQ